jgi:hypothetical protein
VDFPGLLAFRRGRTIVKDVALGIIAGSVLAVITAILIINAEDVHIQTTVNGWSATLKCDERRNGILLGLHAPTTLRLSTFRNRKCIGRRSWTAQVIN